MTRLLLPLLLLLAFVLYAIFPTHTYHWDGVLFSIYIEKVHAGVAPLHILFHANHLLYSVFGFYIYSFAQALGLKLRALQILQAANIVLSVAACALFFALARRALSSRAHALVASLLFAFGALWWKYSTDGDSYILTVFFLLVAALALTANPIRLVLACLAHVAAMLFHELAVFFFVPVLLVIWQEPGRSRTTRIRRCLLYSGVVGALIGLIYFACYQTVDRQVSPTLLSWVSSYASDSSFARSPLELFGPNLLSYTKLLLGGKPAFIKEYFSWPVLLALLIFVSAVIAAIRFRHKRRTYVVRPADRRFPLLLWGWLGAIGLFLALFEPGNPIHKVLVWAPVVLLLLRWLDRKPRWGERTLSIASLCVAIAAWNFAAFAYPHSQDTADPVLVLAKLLARELPPGAPVYYRAFSPDDWTLAYFTPAHNWQPLPTASTPAAPACFETTALAGLPPGLQLDPTHDWKLINSHHHVEVACLLPPK